MVTMEDWIRVELSPADQELAEVIAVMRQTEAGAKGYKPKGNGDITTHRLGAGGEVAAARYVGWDITPESYAEERKRGSDLPGGREVRTMGQVRFGLGLHADSKGPFMMVLGHEAPVYWLVGWIDAAEGLPIAKPHTVNGFTFYSVAKEALHPLREKPGFPKRGRGGWLVDPQTPFYCDSCKSMHPIIEHRQCRAQD